MPKIIKNNTIYGSSSAMVELTQAEYNALSSAQKNNGTIYLITDSDPEIMNLSSLNDVSVSGATQGQVLTKGTSSWEASSLSTVATSGSYTDLSNKPTIPTVNNATLTIQKNSTNVATFTANASTNVTANISVPTKTSQLTNDRIKDWTLYGSTTGTIEKSLPTTYTELLIQVVFDNGVFMTSIFCKKMLTTTYQSTTFGTYGTSYCIGQIKADKVQIVDANYGGTTKTSTMAMYVYYR